MSRKSITLASVAIAIVLYAPIGIYVFDLTLSAMFDRAYFTLAGAAIALYAHS